MENFSVNNFEVREASRYLVEKTIPEYKKKNFVENSHFLYLRFAKKIDSGEINILTPNKLEIELHKVQKFLIVIIFFLFFITVWNKYTLFGHTLCPNKSRTR
jgi:hypothetical protein